MNKNSGFSLLEMVVALGIASILIGVAVPNMTGLVKQATQHKVRANWVTSVSMLQNTLSDIADDVSSGYVAADSTSYTIRDIDDVRVLDDWVALLDTAYSGNAFGPAPDNDQGTIGLDLGVTTNVSDLEITITAPRAGNFPGATKTLRVSNM